MEKEIEYEYNEFLIDVSETGFIFGRYMDVDDYEDEYSHDAIDEAIEIMEEKIRTYLHKNRPGKFVVSSGWCVFVMTPDRAIQSRMPEKTIEDSIVR